MHSYTHPFCLIPSPSLAHSLTSYLSLSLLSAQIPTFTHLFPSLPLQHTLTLSSHSLSLSNTLSLSHFTPSPSLTRSHPLISLSLPLQHTLISLPLLLQHTLTHSFYFLSLSNKSPTYFTPSPSPTHSHPLISLPPPLQQTLLSSPLPPFLFFLLIFIHLRDFRSRGLRIPEVMT